MINLNGISSLLEGITRVCGIEFQVRENGHALFSTPSFGESVSDTELHAAISQATGDEKSFYAKLPSNECTICSVPIEIPNNSRNWIIALTCENGQSDLRSLLETLAGLFKSGHSDQQEIDELARALDRSFEELALYRRIQKSFSAGGLSSSEMSQIAARLKDLLHADLVFGYFPSTLSLNIMHSSPEVFEKSGNTSFEDELIGWVADFKPSVDQDYFIINNSSGDPVLKTLGKRPFRLMAAKAVHNGQSYGWIGMITFSFNFYFNRSHLNMLRAAASQAAIEGANGKLLGGLEGLTTQVASFKDKLASGWEKSSSIDNCDDLLPGDFLKEAFGKLSQSIETAKTLMRRNAQMATMGQLAAVFAHEIKQPVCALDGLIQIAQLKSSKPGSAPDLKTMAKAVRRITNIIQRFQSFSRPPEPHTRPVSLNRIGREVYNLVKPQLEFKQITSDFQRAKDLPNVMGDTQGLQQAALNLVNNAIQAMESNNGRSCQLEINTYLENHYACLEVADTGQGISKDIVSKVIEPYFSTKTSDNGMGLGLSVVTDIVEQHGGHLQIESTPGQGSRFTIKLPVPPQGPQVRHGRKY